MRGDVVVELFAGNFINAPGTIRPLMGLFEVVSSALL